MFRAEPGRRERAQQHLTRLAPSRAPLATAVCVLGSHVLFGSGLYRVPHVRGIPIEAEGSEDAGLLREKSTRVDRPRPLPIYWFFWRTRASGLRRPLKGLTVTLAAFCWFNVPHGGTLVNNGGGSAHRDDANYPTPAGTSRLLPRRIGPFSHLRDCVPLRPDHLLDLRDAELSAVHTSRTTKSIWAFTPAPTRGPPVLYG